jgi:hypothetical protein
VPTYWAVLWRGEKLPTAALFLLEAGGEGLAHEEAAGWGPKEPAAAAAAALLHSLELGPARVTELGAQREREPDK